MLIFGHVGITVTAAQAARPGEDLRAPAAMAILPDLIDKPVSLLWPSLVNESTRAFAHSLAGALAALAALMVVGGRKPRTALLWACYVGHLALDRMWRRDDLAILLWPLMGWFPAPRPGGFFESRLMPYNIAGEILGLLLLLELARRYRLFDGARRRAFWRTGVLGPK